ncbi:hypothetical protein DOK67_0000171 [Enterococcus sp. DIV0212c]
MVKKVFVYCRWGKAIVNQTIESEAVQWIIA